MRLNRPEKFFKKGLTSYRNHATIKSSKEKEIKAMRINYYYTTKATIIFDDEFKLHETDSLDNIVCKIEWAFHEYGFTKAEVIDSDTGELLVTVDDDD